MSTVNQNQFKKGAIPGQVDLKSGGLDTSFTGRIDPDSAASDIEPGTGLKLVDGGANDPNGVPLFDVLSADTEVPFGARIYDLKNGVVQPGEIVQVTYRGVVQFMEAAAALSRGVGVALDVLNPGQVKAVGTDAQYGILLDKSFASGDIVRVLVDPAAPST